MKSLYNYINEKLILNKDTFKSVNLKTKKSYFPYNKNDLINIIESLLNEAYKNGETQISLNSIETKNIVDTLNLFVHISNDIDSNILNSFTVIDVSEWDVSNVTDTQFMFAFLPNVISFGDLSNWDLSNVNYTNCMFQGCKSLEKLNLSRWNFVKCKSFKQMFSECENLESIGDISNWFNKTSKKTFYFDKMFYDCKKLQNIGDINKWPVGGFTTCKQIFTKATYLRKQYAKNIKWIVW